MSFNVFKSKKQSKEARKRMEHLMYVAKESPEKSYDLSSCEILNVPSGVFTMCRVLQKESLLLHTNWLKNLKTGGKIEDLMTLRILDLHGNKLVALPDEICTLKNLQVLNIENNEIQTLPNKLGDLGGLQTLHARDNKLTGLPSSIERAKSLRTIDISGTNKVLYLPKTICKVRTLEVLILANPAAMEYPPPFVAEKGLEEMMKFICKDCGIEYVPPSHNLLPVLGNQESTTVTDGAATSQRVEQFENSIMEYEKMKDEKRKRQLEIEKQLAENQMEQAKLAAWTLTNRAKDLEEISKKQEEFDKSVLKQQEQQELERKRMIRMMVEAEKSASSLVEDLLKINEKARKQEALLEEMEKQRMREEEYFKVTKEDLDNLRKKEMLAAMQAMVAENDQFAIKVKQYLAEQTHAAKRAQGSVRSDGKQVEAALLKQQECQDKLIGQILHEEDVQRQAFIVLQLEKDIARRRIISQIQEVQNALLNLTLVEMKRNTYKLDNEQEVLRSKRQELTDILMVLLKEKDKREEIMKERLIEMEGQRESDQMDFWLVQYQRLMDSKPEKLIAKETEMDVALLKLLSKAGANDHVTSFARNKVCSIRDLIDLSEGDLRRVGVFEVGVRKNILRLVEEEIAASKKLNDYEIPSVSKQPVTPPIATPTATPTDTPFDDLTEENECTVCMEKQSNTIFLPCGHVCTCSDCSSKLQKCPMCRADVQQKIQVFRS
ncbi:E3 ubiquitin-protein ligase LRSAM1-like isoform X2 [Styela clava]